jgi:hypothetical protein
VNRVYAELNQVVLKYAVPQHLLLNGLVHRLIEEAAN